MRVLILSAFLAYAAAAPSGIVAPLIYQPVAINAAIPTISPGDIQAAAIDAQVKFNDLARAAADKAQEVTDQTVQNINAKTFTDVALANEKNVEAFWSNEDKRWQAIDALKTAEAQIEGAAAQIDGVAASNAGLYAKSTISGVVPYVTGIGAVAPVVAAPIPPVVYNPYLAAVKSVSTQTVEVKAEEKKEENQEAAVKTAAPEKPAEPQEAEKVEAATEKSAENKPVVLTSSVVSPFASVYRYDVAVPAGQFLAQPVLNYAAIQPVHGVLAPTVVKSVW